MSTSKPRALALAWTTLLLGCPSGGDALSDTAPDDTTDAQTSTTTLTTTTATTGDPTTATTGDPTTDGGSTGLPGVCGDGVEDPGEACDDGDDDADDACTPACVEQRALAVTVGLDFSCATLSGGAVKCWGKNLDGQLGLGDMEARGGMPGEMGDALPHVDLGGLPVVEIDSGLHATCARFEDGRIKCWGIDEYGELGTGDGFGGHGAFPGEMGDALPFVDLGAGRTAVSLSVGLEFACAALDDGDVKCWGHNWKGQLGLGDTLDRGASPADLGDNLPAVELGAGAQALRVELGVVHACALLQGGAVKCWGRNNLGQLGLGDTEDRGDGPGEMGDALPTVDLGRGAVVTAVHSGGGHVCALLTTGAVKCWGHNDRGQLGRGDLENRGDGPGEMGDALPAVDLGTGRTAVALGGTIHSTCAILDDGTLKCWGWNGYGQLGLGDYVSRGFYPGQMGDALPTVDLGAGRTAVALSTSPEGSHQCAVLDDGALKCWGNNWVGQLGIGDYEDRGGLPGQMGDALPTVKLYSANL